MHIVRSNEESCLRPAADYHDQVDDAARHDNELVRLQSTDGAAVRISVSGGPAITPIGEVRYRLEIRSNHLVACFSTAPNLFTEFPDTDACLIIHEVDQFCERLHAAAEAQLPDWAGFDAAVIYGGRHPLGAVLSRPLHFNDQQASFPLRTF